MHAVIAWSGFLGAWLLVAGPMFQAAVELDGGEHQRDWLAAAARRVAPPPRSSPWWWLLPPVAYVRQRLRQRDYRQRVLDALSPDEVETFVTFTNVSTGWAMVAGGAFFIAVKETYEVAELDEWPRWLFSALLVLMLALSAAHTVIRVRRARQVLDEHGPARSTAPPPTPS